MSPYVDDPLAWSERLAQQLRAAPRCPVCNVRPRHDSAAPDNARGIPAGSVFWRLCDADRERFRSGWWAAYDASPSDERVREVLFTLRDGWPALIAREAGAFTLGYLEALVSLGLAREATP